MRLVARQAVIALREFQSKAKSIDSPKDLLTNADLMADEIIKNGLLALDAVYVYISEEHDNEVQKPLAWIVDPLDGTANYLAGSDAWAVSIARVDNGKVVDGVVCTGDGKEYTTHDKYHHVSRHLEFKTSRIGTDWTKRESDRDVIELLRGLRFYTRYPLIAGCISKTLIDVAVGRLDGCIHMAPQVYDFAAAAAIVDQASGKVTDVNGSPWSIRSESIVATNGLIHDELLELIQKTMQ